MQSVQNVAAAMSEHLLQAIRRLNVGIFVLVATLSVLPATSVYAAGTASFQLTRTGSGTVTVGNTVQVQLKVNAADVVNSLSTTILYPQGQLQLVSGSISLAVPGACSATASTGSIVIKCTGSVGIVQGALPIAAASFKATAAGNAMLSTNGGSIVSYTGQNIFNGSPASLILTLAAPAAPSTPKTTTTTTTPTAGSSGTTSKTTAAGSGSGTSTGSSTASGGSSSNKSSANSASAGSNGSSSSADSAATAPEITVSTTATTSDGKAVPKSQGALWVTITDKNGKPLPNVAVSLNGKSMGATNTAGDYEIANVTPGKYTLTTSQNGTQKSKSQVTIASGKEQRVKIQLAAAHSAVPVVAYVAGGAVILVTVFGFSLRKIITRVQRKRSAALNGSGGGDTSVWPGQTIAPTGPMNTYQAPRQPDWPQQQPVLGGPPPPGNGMMPNGAGMPPTSPTPAMPADMGGVPQSAAFPPSPAQAYQPTPLSQTFLPPQQNMPPQNMPPQAGMGMPQNINMPPAPNPPGPGNPYEPYNHP